MRALLLVVAMAVICVSVTADRVWDEYGEYAQTLKPLEPTPTGEGHLGAIKSGEFVQLRFPVPKRKPLGYWLSLGNIVGMSGRGTSYQLVLRRDSSDGPVIYTGPMVANGDEWNATNRPPINVTEHLREEDFQRGYLDVFATALVQGDDWTVYRHNPKGRRIAALAAVVTPEIERRIAAAKALKEAGLALLPLPQEIELKPGRFALSERTAIVLDRVGEDRVPAQELAGAIEALGGPRPKIVGQRRLRRGDIYLSASEGDPQSEAYRLEITPENVRVKSSGARGRFYGLQTLTQLIARDDKGTYLPCLRINDYPAFPIRGFQYDIARGQTVNVEWMKRVIREAARMKMNAIMYYLEDDFKFDKYPFTGRPGTFTPAKARELSRFADQYHVMLIPQYEMLGHAGAVLRHEELKDLREAGGSWVFCTSEPKVWEFLGNAVTELAGSFTNTKYIHVGGDEFEFGFGKCERCKAKIAEEGIGGLYAEHMNRLDDLVKGQGKTMLFWPSHHGPTRELSRMSLQYKDLMHKDMIPTEWIYHGPSSYPQIKEYQDAGYVDVWACPAVVYFSQIYANYPTSFRGIRGFFRAGAERKIGGALTTTWEFMYGGNFENAWLGLAYTGECAWSLGQGSVADFESRWGQYWLGLRGDDIAERVHETLAEPVPSKGPAAMWRNQRMIRNILWTDWKALRREWALKNRRATENAPLLVQAMDEALQRVAGLRKRARRNEITLDFAELAFRLMRHCGQRLVAFQEATDLYEQAEGAADNAQCAALVTQAADKLAALLPEYEYFAERYAFGTTKCGAAQRDQEALAKQQAALKELVAAMRAAAEKAKAGGSKALPPASDFGLFSGVCEQVGAWRPEVVKKEETVELKFDITKYVQSPGVYLVEWLYDRGAHGVNLQGTRLLEDGEPVASDEHKGWTGAGTRNNIYRLELKAVKPGAKYEIVGKLAASGGTDSRGRVWLTPPRSK